MTSKIILIDGHSVASQARYTTGSLSSNGKPTGVIFGFLSRILSLSKQQQSKRFVFAWDSPTSLRRKVYPEYKANRKKDWTKEETEDRTVYYDQVNALRKSVLPAIGFGNSFILKGYEGDDIVASVVLTETDPIVIVSSDSDLFQLLREDVSQLTPKGLFTEAKFVEKYGIMPKKWSKVKALAGCTSDNVKGVLGVGEVTAIKFFNKELKEESAKYKAIIANRKIYQRNKQLVTLPYRWIKTFPLEEDELNIDSFVAICNKYKFRSFLRGEVFSQWKMFFGAGRKRV